MEQSTSSSSTSRTHSNLKRGRSFDQTVPKKFKRQRSYHYTTPSPNHNSHDEYFNPMFNVSISPFH